MSLEIIRNEKNEMGWMIGGSTPGRGWEFFTSPLRPDRLRHLHNSENVK